MVRRRTIDNDNSGWRREFEAEKIESAVRSNVNSQTNNTYRCAYATTRQLLSEELPIDEIVTRVAPPPISRDVPAGLPGHQKDVAIHNRVELELHQIKLQAIDDARNGREPRYIIEGNAPNTNRVRSR